MGSNHMRTFLVCIKLKTNAKNYQTVVTVLQIAWNKNFPPKYQQIKLIVPQRLLSWQYLTMS